MKRLTYVMALMLLLGLSACSIFKKTQTQTPINPALAGDWELTYITGPRIAFEGLYPEAKPTISFDLEEKRIGGNNSCNSYGGELVVKGDSIKMDKSFSTMMACPGAGEATYMKALKEVETFAVRADTLSFYKGEIELMRFRRK